MDRGQIRGQTIQRFAQTEHCLSRLLPILLVASCAPQPRTLPMTKHHALYAPQAALRTYWTILRRARLAAQRALVENSLATQASAAKHAPLAVTQTVRRASSVHWVATLTTPAHHVRVVVTGNNRQHAEQRVKYVLWASIRVHLQASPVPNALTRASLIRPTVHVAPGARRALTGSSNAAGIERVCVWKTCSPS